MWRKFSILVFLASVLPGCHTAEPPPDTPENLASICQILRAKLQAVPNQGEDMSTMKRKNPVDQAELLREYYSYDCPTIVDFTPPP